MTRRELLKTTGLALSGALLPNAKTTAAAVDAPGGNGLAALSPLNRFPGAVQEFLLGRVREATRVADARRAALRTPEDALRYIAEVKGKIRQCFGPLPERTPLRARTTGVLQRDTYTVEKIIFESRPNFLVTGNLYLPRGGAAKRPGVIGTCGHCPEGKAMEQYQAFAQGLARQGYVVLIYDPAGQGERSQYVDGRYRPTRPGGGVEEHVQAGNQQALVGEFFGTWRAWDGIRALDYLSERPEVDATRIGVTGNSGGGTEATWLCALDPRWAMAAPATFITTYAHNLENQLASDTEQCPPSALALGLDECDFLVAMAPKPLLVMGVEKDFFDARGLEEAYGQLRHIYRLLGHEDRVRLFIDDAYHNYTARHRAAMYELFNGAVGLGRPLAEPPLPIEKTEDLWCTPRGQVAAVGSKPVFAFTAEKGASLRRRRGPLAPEALAQAIRTVLKVTAPPSAPHYRILQPGKPRGYPKPFATTYVIEAEHQPLAVAYRLSETDLPSRPPRTGGRALLYVAHASADVELRESGFVAELCRTEGAAAIYACDVRGSGELRPLAAKKKDAYWADHLHASYGLMLDLPYLGQKTSDVWRVLQWLSACDHREIHLAADGWGALPALFAAVLADNVVQVTLRRSLSSFGAVAEAPEYRWPGWTLPFGVLEHFDLDDCYRALGAKQLRRIEPWGPERDGGAPLTS